MVFLYRFSICNFRRSIEKTVVSCRIETRLVSVSRLCRKADFDLWTQVPSSVRDSGEATSARVRTEVRGTEGGGVRANDSREGQWMATGCDVTRRHATPASFTRSRESERGWTRNSRRCLLVFPVFSRDSTSWFISIDSRRQRSGIGNYWLVTVPSRSRAARLRKWLPELIRINQRPVRMRRRR